MVWEREVKVEGTVYRVIISDSQEALLAAKAAGRVSVGLLRGTEEQESSWEAGVQDLWAAEYVVETLEAADEAYLERVVRRHRRLPWVIGESEELLVREFTVEDAKWVPEEPGDTEADGIFYTPDKLRAYIEGQYRFYEYGVWAVVRKSDGRIVGKAGVSDCDIGRGWGVDAEARRKCVPGAEKALELEKVPGAEKASEAEKVLEPEKASELGGVPEPDMCLELGYHIFGPYRRRGYGRQACAIVLDYVRATCDCPVYAVTDTANVASVRLLRSLGFQAVERLTEAEGTVAKMSAAGSRQEAATEQRYSESEIRPCLFVRCWQ